MNRLKEFYREESAVTVVEILLVLIILIAAALIFKKQIISLVEGLMSKVTSQSSQV